MFDNYEDIITVEELLQILHIGRNSVYHILRKGEIKAFQYGRTWKIPRKAVEEYVLRKCKMST